MDDKAIITGLNNCSGCGEDCNCLYSDNPAGSYISSLCRNTLLLIEELKR